MIVVRSLFGYFNKTHLSNLGNILLLKGVLNMWMINQQ